MLSLPLTYSLCNNVGLRGLPDSMPLQSMLLDTKQVHIPDETAYAEIPS
jgi:hypothetical protein